MDLKGEKVFVRADFNVPLDKEQNITDDIRICETIPTIKYVLDKGGAVIVASHLGRPKGKVAKEFSLRPVQKRLSELLGKEVLFADDCIGDDARVKAGALKPGQVLLLENLRFYAQEEKNDEEFAGKLAELADVYINDAFAVSHRAHASVEAITRFMKECGAGFLMKKEITSFEKALNNPQRPLVAIIGGAKVSGKLEALENIIQKVDAILIGGGMAFTFLKAQGMEVGKSLVEDELLETAKTIMQKAKDRGVRIVLPVDCVAAREMKSCVPYKTISVKELTPDLMGLDIGQETIAEFGKVIKDAKTIVWNGPMGVFELEEFSRGTFAVIDQIAGSSAMSVVGGGDTDSALHKSGKMDKITFVSTAGGAFMELLEGKVLPGIKALDK
ncbi:MAG: phosphoglycerate kinase [Proteobacteria bacterium]|nr:phosphoglycerate kinase [Pseudomonadota bacterium]